jgi:ATP-dependent Lhr-like helicase
VVEGEFTPGAAGAEWCDAQVLRRLRRRSLAAARHEVEPVSTAAFGRFLPSWQHIGGELRGVDGVAAVVEQLAGVPIPASAWESLILPARVPGYTPAMLDELMATGEVIWSGHGAITAKDGWIALHLAEQAPFTLAPPDELDPTDAQARLLNALGATFVPWTPPGPAQDVPDRAPVSLDEPDPPSGSAGDGRGAHGRSGDTDGHADGAAAPVGNGTDNGRPAPVDSAYASGAGHPTSGAPAQRLIPVPQGGGAYFFRQLSDATGLLDDAAVASALWELVWSGVVSGDTFAPVRALLSGTTRTTTAHRTPRRAPRGRAYLPRPSMPTRSGPPSVAGRWSLLPERVSDNTVRAHATADLLLERYGVLTRGSVQNEGVPGGFALMYRVLTEFEDRGRCRRGYFVDSLGGAQFSTTDVVDRLRSFDAERARPESRHGAGAGRVRPRESVRRRAGLAEERRRGRPSARTQSRGAGRARRRRTGPVSGAGRQDPAHLHRGSRRAPRRRRSARRPGPARPGGRAGHRPRQRRHRARQHVRRIPHRSGFLRHPARSTSAEPPMNALPGTGSRLREGAPIPVREGERKGFGPSSGGRGPGPELRYA